MQFFQQLLGLDLTGTIRLGITPVNGKMTVSVVVDNTACTDPAKFQIIPLTVTGTAVELDEGFIQAIKAPLKQSSGLQLNMVAYQNSVETAKKASASAGKVVSPAPPVVDKKAEKFKQLMAEVVTLRDKKQYLEAIKKLPDAKEFPEQKDLIENRRKWLTQEEADRTSMFPANTMPWPEDEPAQAPVAGLAPESELAGDPDTNDAEEGDEDGDERDKEALDSEFVDNQ